MPRIFFYILRTLLVALAVGSAVLAFAGWMTQSLRMVELLIESPTPLDVFGVMLATALPNLLALVLPLALAGAVIFTYLRLIADSEIVVMRASGAGPVRLALPAVAAALLVTGLCYALNLHFVPMAARMYQNLSDLARSEVAGLLVQEGRFNTLGDSVTVYVREQDDSGALAGLLVQDGRDADRPVTIAAARGLVTDTAGGPRVLLYDGIRQQSDRATHRLDTLYFDQYAVDLSVYRPEPASPRLPKRARFVGELLHPDPADPRDREEYGEMISLAHERLSWPLLPVAFALLSVGVLLSGGASRRGTGRRALAAAGAVAALQIGAVLASHATRGAPALVPLMYALPLAGGVLGAVLMHRPVLAHRATAPLPA